MAFPKIRAEVDELRATRELKELENGELIHVSLMNFLLDLAEAEESGDQARIGRALAALAAEEAAL